MSLSLTLFSLGAALTCKIKAEIDKRKSSLPSLLVKPVSVNYHFHRVCNYECGFCFHTAKSSTKLPLESVRQGLTKLVEAGMKKINFSGGEPFLHADHLGAMVKMAKDLGVESVSIVSNGSLIRKDWFEKYAEYLDILAVSCDSFDDDTNDLIGRRARKGDGRSQTEVLRDVAALCNNHNVLFKINTVVCAFNKNEDMAEMIMELAPCRWKVFQVLALEGENQGETARRNVTPFLISDADFDAFVERHKRTGVLVPESNSKMQNSYLILDEDMSFLDCTGGAKTPSRSIINVGVETALKEAGFDHDMFIARKGMYKWKKEHARALPGRRPPPPQRQTLDF